MVALRARNRRTSPTGCTGAADVPVRQPERADRAMFPFVPMASSHMSEADKCSARAAGPSEFLWPSATALSRKPYVCTDGISYWQYELGGPAARAELLPASGHGNCCGNYWELRFALRCLKIRENPPQSAKPSRWRKPEGYPR